MNDPWRPSPAHTRADTALLTYSTPMTERKMFAVCTFYIRSAAPEGGWFLDLMTISSPDGDGNLRTAHPPQVGDLIRLYDMVTKQGGPFRVVAREWRHSSYGSVMWPLLDDVPKEGPSLDVVIVPAEQDGVFHGQVSRSEEEADG